jgi:hypothetical protein
MKRPISHLLWWAAFGLLLLAAGGLLGLAKVQRSVITSLRQEVRSLRLQLETLERVRSNTREQPAGRLPEEQFRELLRLRGKAGLFRSQAEELAQLQQENRRLRAVMASPQFMADGTTNTFAARSFVPLTQLSFAGYATPEAALESILWAERETNLTAYLTSLIPDQQSVEQARLQTQIERKRRIFFPQETGGVTGFQVLDSKPISDDQVAVTFFVGGHDGIMKLPVRRIGNEWKLYAGPTF